MIFFRPEADQPMADILVFIYLRTSFLRVRAGRNLGIFDAAILILAPVRGLTPALAFLLPTSKVPNPVSVTFPPFLSSLETIANAVSIPTVASLRDKPVFFATASISSDLFILSFPASLCT